MRSSLWGTTLVLSLLCLVVAAAGSCGSDGGQTAKVCTDVNCGGHGRCLDDNGAAVCLCESGYKAVGLTCQQDVISGNDACAGISCSGHGHCSASSGAAACVCDSGYHPDKLSCVQNNAAAPCTGVDCGTHGRCVEDSGAPACLCESGYHPGQMVCVKDQVTAHDPKILNLSSNVKALESGDSLVLTAVVTDPDGIDDLIGGTASDSVNSATYGAFATSAQEGSYSITLPWAAIQQVRTIDTPSGGADRGFVATFFDVDGHQVSATITIHLQCKNNAALGVCKGVCVDLSKSVEHCGKCNNKVTYTGGSCNSGQPGCPKPLGLCGTACLDLSKNLSNCGKCNHDCSKIGNGKGTRPICEGGTCFAEFAVSSRDSCDSQCAKLGLGCTTYPYSLYCGSFSANDVNACATYACPSGQSTIHDVFKCGTTPDATEDYYGTCTFQSMFCACSQ
jgi:hypothetical protein